MVAVLEGHISVLAALEGESREVNVIYIEEGKRDRAISRVERAARRAGVPVEQLPAAQIEERAGGSTHGGLIAEAGPRRFVELGDLLPEEGAAYIAMLDGIEDPYNFGYALRAFYAAGADGIVVRPRSWTSAAGTVARASAGTSERVPLAMAETALDAAAFCRQRGLLIACTGTGGTPIYEADLSQPLFLLVGGERRGITRSFINQADLVLSIPYGRPFDKSLGTAAAAGVLAFEVMRQRYPTR